MPRQKLLILRVKEQGAEQASDIMKEKNRIKVILIQSYFDLLSKYMTRD